MNRRVIVAALPLAVGLGFFAEDAFAGKPSTFTGLVRGVAAGGYDVVAYFSGTAVPGDPSITAEHDGATYRFSSNDNREAFVAEPARYAPQFGGYCAWAVAKGYTAKGDPEAWSVEGGKLYLNYSASVRRNWLKDVPGHITRGEANWPKVLE